MFRVADVMTTELVTLRENEELNLAETILYLGRIRHLPVVKDDGTLAGLVTHRDLLRVYAERGIIEGKALLAGEVMTTPVLTVRPETPLRKALQTMMHHKVGCVLVTEPVKGADGEKAQRPVGIITEFDLVRFSLRVIDDLDDLERAALTAVRAEGARDEPLQSP